MRVSLAEIQRYAKTLGRLSDVAAERSSAAIALWMTNHPDASVAECREFAIMAVSDAVTKYGDAAATSAATLYDEVMSGEGVDVPSAILYEGPDEGAIEGTVRRLAGRLAGDRPDVDGFLEQVRNLSSDKVRDAASETVMKSVERVARTKKGKGIRYARIPQRPDPCPWCIMLACRGFDYKSAKSAGAGKHHNCTCLVVAGIKDKTEVEGYDPKGMYDRYKSCEKTIKHDLQPSWDAMSPAEREEYEDFNDYCKKRILEEMDNRDRQWLKTGRPTPIDYTEKTREQYGELIDVKRPLSRRYLLDNITGKDNERKDVFAHDVLSANGFAVRGRLTINQGGDENIDIDLNGNLCEVKCPEAKPNDAAKDRYKFVYRDVQRARHQFEDRVRKQGKPAKPMRVIMSNYHTGFDAEEEDAIFRRFCHEVERQGFAEGLFITKDGRVRRAK